MSCRPTDTRPIAAKEKGPNYNYTLSPNGTADFVDAPLMSRSIEGDTFAR